MSLNYLSYITRIYALMGENRDDFPYPTAIPAAIEYAEQRIYRELDLLATRVTDATKSLTTSNRNFALSTASGTYLVVEQVNVITPATATSTSGTRVPLVNTSRDFIDITYPSNASGTNTPEFFAMVDNANIIVGPAPNSSYVLETIGTQRPSQLSSANSSTILTQMLPDLFTAASMVFLTNYAEGAPQLGSALSQYWEGQYSKLMQSANVEEVRKKYQSQAWTNQQPSPLATPPRV